jgi:type IV secretion system protein VirB5
MLNRKPKPADAEITTIPGVASEASRRTFFSRGSAISLERNHWRVATFALIGALCLSSIAIFKMQPLVRVQAVLIHQSPSGRLSAQPVDDKAFSPDQAAIAYALNSWASNLITVNSTIQSELIDKALSMATAQGVDQVKAFYQANNPAAILKDKPLFLRTYHYLSINFINTNAALLRFQTTDRAAPGADPQNSIFDMTVSFAISPPKTINQAIINPSGVYVTSFNLNKEAST